MVGLVVVSHSRALAEAAVALAAEMVPDGRVPLEVAAGLDETTFGTDAIAISEAVTTADHGDGVVVLMDLGSAVLSAELALDFLPDDQRERVLLTPAPLIEGLLAATVTAAGGATRHEVAAEATAALSAKQSHLAPTPSHPAPPHPAPPAPPDPSPPASPQSAATPGPRSPTDSAPPSREAGPAPDPPPHPAGPTPLLPSPQADAASAPPSPPADAAPAPLSPQAHAAPAPPSPSAEGAPALLSPQAGGATGPLSPQADAAPALLSRPADAAPGLASPPARPAAGSAAVGAGAGGLRAGEAAVAITVGNRHGLHARPAARLVTTARGFDATVEVRNATTGSQWVPAGSLSRVATLGVLRGHRVEVRASGREAAVAVDAIAGLAARNFDEPGAATPPPTGPPPLPDPATGDGQPATPASDDPPATIPAGTGEPAKASGGGEEATTTPTANGEPTTKPHGDGGPGRTTADVDGSAVAEDGGGASATVPAGEGGPAEVAGAGREPLGGVGGGGGGASDPVVGAGCSGAVPERVLWGFPASPGVGIGPARRVDGGPPELPDVASRGAGPEGLRVGGALEAVRGELRRLRAGVGGEVFDAHLALLDDEELLADVRSELDGGSAAPQAWAAAAARVAGAFDALPDPYLRARAADVRAVSAQVLRAMLGSPAATLDDAGVIVAGDLAPADVAGLDLGRVGGILLAGGSPTSHAAILARTRGIPAVVGVEPALLDVADGTPVALDGASGEVVVDPSGPVLDGLRARAAEQASGRARARARATEAAVTRDGVTLAVGANVGSVEDARAAAAGGADLAGLIRTEFLFLGRASAPGVDEQEAVYRELAGALGGRRLTIRTLDVGGDKPLPYARAEPETNPFLGVRGIRHSLAHPRLFADQLLAIVRVARDVPVSVMFPMISTVDEVVAARRMLDDAVRRGGAGAPPGLEAGIMMEVPAAALKAAVLAPYVDFFSVGTNDLTQYALAAERGNAAVASLADGLDPGVLRLIDAICRGAGERVTVSVCGELAADEAAVPVLAGLGVRELSVAPPAVPAVKQAVRALDLGRAAGVAARSLSVESARAVRALVADRPQATPENVVPHR